MALSNNNDIKIVNGKFFIYSRKQNRFFPIKMKDAVKMIETGEAQYI